MSFLVSRKTAASNTYLPFAFLVCVPESKDNVILIGFTVELLTEVKIYHEKIWNFIRSNHI